MFYLPSVEAGAPSEFAALLLIEPSADSSSVSYQVPSSMQ